MEATSSIETLVIIYDIARRHIWEDSNFQQNLLFANFVLLKQG
jgi:hypothetical protein